MSEKPDTGQRKDHPGLRQRVGQPISIVWGIIGIVTTLGGLLTFFLVDIEDIRASLLPATPTPVAPTPDPDDIVVLVPDFAGAKGSAAADRVYAALQTRVEISDLDDLYPARRSGVAPVNAEQADREGEQSGATLVLWGWADDISIELHYRVMRNQNRLRVQPEISPVLSANPEDLNMYVAQNAPREMDYLMLVTAAQIRYAEEKYQEAADLYSLALDIDLGPRADGFQLPRVYLFRGLARYYTGDFEGAHADFDMALGLDESLSAAYEGRGSVRYTWGRFDEALDDFDAALALTPQSVSALNSRAYTLATMNRDLDRALADIEQALRMMPGNPSYVDTRGYVHYQMGDLDAALADFQHALDGGETFAYYGRGLVHQARGENGAASEDFAAFLERHPTALIQVEDIQRRLADLDG